MLLHEIYGKELFQITRYEIDILRYRPKSVLLAQMAGGGGGGGSSGLSAGAYIEDSNHIRNTRNEDVRLDISPSFGVNYTNNADADADMNVENDRRGGGLLSGIKWLFGSEV
jgi:hypothetical protein